MPIPAGRAGTYNGGMMTDELQEQCELGQQELMRTNYVEAERILADAEAAAWEQQDWDTLARLYMPLQEARRQRRQRCGEGDVVLDLAAEGEHDRVEGRHVVENYPFGQLLVAGWGSVEPAAEVRRLQREHELYVETFLGAVYPTDDAGRVIVIVPFELDKLPAPAGGTLSELEALLPRHSLVYQPSDLPAGPQRGNARTFSLVMGIWERLHTPFLRAAEAEFDPMRKIEKFRRAIQVDYACELAHQHLSALAHELARQM